MPDQEAARRYYANSDVRARLREYAADAAGLTSAVTITGLDPGQGSMPMWETATAVPAAGLETLLDRGCDVSRSLWDRQALIFALDLDYLNVDYPGEAFTHPAEVLFKLEPAYRAIRRVLRRFHLDALRLATGRGYHFTGRVPLDSAVVDRLAAIGGVPSWLATLDQRRPARVTATMSPRHAAAAEGLGRVVEFVAHLVLGEGASHSALPLVVNGTLVGRGAVGRECASIDFSSAGDPLDSRHVRMAFSTYQWHRARPDIFGPFVSGLPPLATVPRGARSWTSLARARDLASAAEQARETHVILPDVRTGMTSLVTAYEQSALAAFHKTFAAEREAIVATTPRPPVPPDVPPCALRPLAYPNDRLLKPEHLQHVVRTFMARGWRPAQIAALVLRQYERPCGWGTRWTRLDARTRADFDVRVFAGLVATHLDTMVDFNCTSAQEKDVCPWAGCRHDLRDDRDALLARLAS